MCAYACLSLAAGPQPKHSTWSGPTFACGGAPGKSRLYLAQAQTTGRPNDGSRNMALLQQASSLSALGATPLDAPQRRRRKLHNERAKSANLGPQAPRRRQIEHGGGRVCPRQGSALWLCMRGRLAWPAAGIFVSQARPDCEHISLSDTSNWASTTLRPMLWAACSSALVSSSLHVHFSPARPRLLACSPPSTSLRPQPLSSRTLGAAP